MSEIPQNKCISCNNKIIIGTGLGSKHRQALFMVCKKCLAMPVWQLQFLENWGTLTSFIQKERK